MAPISLTDIVSALPSDESWGPATSKDTTLGGVPYAPYSKGDKLGRMADWTSEGKDGRDGRGGRQAYNRNYRDQQVYGAGTTSLFAVQLAEDESSFSVVSNERTSAKTRGFGRGGGTVFRGRGQRGAQNVRGGGGRGQFQRVGQGGRGGQQGGDRYYDNRGGRGGGGGGRGRRFGWKDYDKPARNRDASVNIKPEWKMLEEIDFNRLAKLNLETNDGEDLDTYGFLQYYDRSYDKQQTLAGVSKTSGGGAERKLAVTERAAYNVTTSSDPIIQDLAERDEATIFATDSILSMLMCAPRSVYSWDIVILRQGNKVFLDKRDGSALDMVSVNENAADAPLELSEGGKDSINNPSALALEATFINTCFANQVVLDPAADNRGVIDMAHPNPFYDPTTETDPPASKAYKYRRYDLSLNDEDPVHLIVRTELDAVIRPSSSTPSSGSAPSNKLEPDDQTLTLKALNEFDHKAQGSGGALDWRLKLASARGAVVATEMKNNSVKLARWTTQAILARADVMKLGFVSRVSPKSNDRHVVLGVVGYKPREFANQMNLSLSNGWGIVRTIVDIVGRYGGGGGEDQEGGEGGQGTKKFVLVKDPNKPLLRLYEVPVGTFEEESGDEEVVEKEESEEE